MELQRTLLLNTPGEHRAAWKFTSGNRIRARCAKLMKSRKRRERALQGLLPRLERLRNARPRRDKAGLRPGRGHAWGSQRERKVGTARPDLRSGEERAPQQ